MKRLYQLKAIWRDQIFADSRLSHATFRVGYGLASYMTLQDTVAEYKRTGDIEVFPSHDSLSRDASVSLDTVRVSIVQLIERGHLEKTRRGNQHSGSNHYRILVKRKGIARYRPQEHPENSAVLPRKIRDACP
jgi:hypothetical protein